MANPDYALLANQLGEFCLDVAEGIGDYIHENIGNLPDDKVTSLERQLDEITADANQFLELADEIAFADLATYLQGIQNAITSIQQALKTIAGIDKAIAIAAAVIELATAIFTQSGSALGAAVKTIGSI
jgi:predicted transcriptional regulator